MTCVQNRPPRGQRLAASHPVRQPPGHERAFIGTYQLLGYLREDKLVQLSPHRKLDTLRPAYGWDEPQPALRAAPPLTLQAISYYQTAADDFASGAMRLRRGVREPVAGSSIASMRRGGKWPHAMP